jgi:flagellar hook-basal body complex protein FliE
VPADEVTHGVDVEASRVRTGPRHAAPKKPLFTRFNRPAGKAIAMAAMPTAVLMGMGFTSTLAIADSDTPAAPTSKSLTADEYKDCVAALEDSDKDSKGDESASPTPSPSASDGATDEKDDQGDTAPKPSPSGGTDANNGGSSSSDSGSDDKAEPTPTPSTSAPATGGDDAAATPSPSPSESGGNVLEDIGDAIGGIFNGGNGGNTDGASPSPTPSASASQSTEQPAEDASDAVKDTTDKVTGTVEDTTGKASDTVKDTGKTVEDTTKAVEKAAEDAAEKAKEATASPSPSPSATTDADDCPAATDAEGGVDNKVPLPDDPWFLNASSLTLKGADYKGVVEVRTADGTVKKVLKYVISGGTDIGDLHQTVQDKQSGKTYHVQAAKGSTSTITGGDTVMYTESISGNLLGLIPITFDPEHPPPLNIPLIYFTNVKVQQAGQFGGTLHVPGLHNFVTG